MTSQFKYFSVLSLLALYGCSTSGKQQTQQRDRKARAAAIKAAPTPAPIPKATPTPAAEELALWTVRMGSPETPFTIQDRQKVASLQSSPKAGSLAEAALVVGILRDIMTPPGGNARFKEVDLNAVGKPTTDEKNVLPKPMRVIDNASVLEIRAREKGLDFTNALANNILLKNIAVFAWTWDAIAMDGNSDIFKQNVTTVIKSEAMLWQELARKSGAISVQPSPTATPAPETGVVVLPTPAATPMPPSAPTPTIDPAAGADAEKQMVLAQEAASKDNFAKAVEVATKIPTTAPNYVVAQDSIKTWSNRAVTDLRKKAAYEYRAAASVTDVGIKRSYLNKAKGYLEEASQKFPQSSNQDTVKDNLNMITKELERLN